MKPANDHVIAVTNLKGGTGKSTTVMNIAGFAGQFGKRVLMVDADPQASITRVCLPEEALNDPNTQYLSDAFARRQTSLEGMCYPTHFQNVQMVPSKLTLEAVMKQAIMWERREYVLQTMLVPQMQDYDLILIDCGPRIDLAATNPLVAARWFLVPMECSFIGLDGYYHVLDLVTNIVEYGVNPHLSLLGLLPTRYDARTTHSDLAEKEIQSMAKGGHPAIEFPPIHRATAVENAAAYGGFLGMHDPKSRAAQNYADVTNRILAFLERAL